METGYFIKRRDYLALSKQRVQVQVAPIIWSLVRLSLADGSTMVEMNVEESKDETESQRGWL